MKAKGDKPKHDPQPHKQFVTAAELARRLAAADGAPVALAANEHLTPAARDVVEQRHLNIARSASQAACPQPPAGTKPIHAPVLSVAHSQAGAVAAGMVIDGRTEAVEAVLAALAREGIRFLDCATGDCPVANLTALCRAISEGRLTCGVAIMPYAADALVLANKFKGIRAVQGTRAASVASAVRHIAANLLVLEHRLSTFYELRSMARLFVADRMGAGAAGALLAAIAEAERTG